MVKQIFKNTPEKNEIMIQLLSQRGVDMTRNRLQDGESSRGGETSSLKEVNRLPKGLRLSLNQNA